MLSGAGELMEDFTKGAAWMQGRIMPIADAGISVLDWGLTRSDITYDVVHAWEGSFFRLDDYLDRFEASVNSLRLDIGQNRESIRKILNDVVASTGLKSAYVSMVASRGTPSIPGTRDPRLCDNHFYAWAVPFVWVIKPEVAKRGAHIMVASTSRRISPEAVDPRVKNYHWGDMTRALFESLDAGFDTCVLLDEQDHVTEGPGFNVFAVTDGEVITPRSGMLEGITRKTVIEICSELGYPCEARDINVSEFLDADEIFTATTAGGPVPVTKANTRILGNGKIGPISEAIMKTYWDWHKQDKYLTPIDY